MQTLVAAAAAAAPLQLEPQKLSKFRKGKCYRINLCRDTNLDSNHHIEEKKSPNLTEIPASLLERSLMKPDWSRQNLLYHRPLMLTPPTDSLLRI